VTKAPRGRGIATGVVRPRRRFERGQALIETAIVVVFALTLFVGVYAVSVAISDSTTAGAATRSGARLAAQVGNNNYTAGTTDACQSATTDPCGVDNQILANVAAGIAGLRFDTPVDIIIYDPVLKLDGSAGSAQCASGTIANSPYVQGTGEYAEKYTYSTVTKTWTATAPPPAGAYTLDKRVQTHPTEGAIGVQLDFTYKSPTPIISVQLSHSEYTVNCFAPSSR
jgi:Flp pilus assembly protein TadG